MVSSATKRAQRPAVARDLRAYVSNRSRSAHQQISPLEVVIVEDPWLEAGGRVCRNQSVPLRNEVLLHRASMYGTWMLSALLTVAMHLLAFAPLLAGHHPSRKAQPPLSEGLAVSKASVDSDESASVLFIFNDRAITPADEPVETRFATPEEVQTAVNESVTGLLTASVSQPEVIGTDEAVDESPAQSGPAGNGSEAAMMFGRYMGQIKARIERSWQWPLNVATKSYECKVQIRQTRSGEVIDITLQRCEMSPEWQLSLVQAIQNASPLSAPPTEKVFSEVITLQLAVPPDLSHPAPAVGSST